MKKPWLKLSREENDLPKNSKLASENKLHFATQLVVSPRNNVWEMSAEIHY